MQFDLEAMSEEELNALLAAVEAKLEEMAGEAPAEGENPEDREGEEETEAPAEEVDPELLKQLTDDIDELEQLVEQITERKAAIKTKAEKRAKLIERIASGKTGKVVRTFKENESEDRKMYDVSSKEYRDLWVKNLQGRLTEEEKRAWASTTSGDNKATNAIPTIISEQFFEKMKKLAPMLSEITLLRVAGNIQFIVEGTRSTATAKHVENSTMAAATDTTVAVSLGGFEFMKVVQISRTAAMMSIDAFQNWLVEMLAGDIARAIDNYILNDATNGIAALTFTTSTQVVNTQGYTYANICDLIAKLPAAYDAEAKFLVNKVTLYGSIAQIEDSTGRPIFVPDTVNGIGGRLMGYPVVVDDYVTTANKALYLGKWTDVVGNLSEDIHVDADESAGFAANAIMYRGIAVFDSKPAKSDAIVRLVCTTA